MKNARRLEIMENAYYNGRSAVSGYDEIVERGLHPNREAARVAWRKQRKREGIALDFSGTRRKLFIGKNTRVADPVPSEDEVRNASLLRELRTEPALRSEPTRSREEVTQEWLACKPIHTAIPELQTFHEKRLMREGETMTLLLAGDLHLLSTDSDEELMHQQFSAARDAGARIIIVGDITDGILYRDKRYQAGRRVEGKEPGEYLNHAMAYTREALSPYAGSIDLLLRGNHSYRRDAEFDLERWLVDEFARDGIALNYGATAAFLVYHVTGMDGSSDTLTIYAEHGGKGGNAAVTKGLIAHNRIAAKVHADLWACGHNHEGYSADHATVTAGADHRATISAAQMIRCNSYLNYGGYAAEANMKPLTTGARVVRVQWREGRLCWVS